MNNIRKMTTPFNNNKFTIYETPVLFNYKTTKEITIWGAHNFILLLNRIVNSWVKLGKFVL